MGIVDRVHLPLMNKSILRYEVDIPIYDQKGSLLTVEQLSCEADELTLLERWDGEKKSTSLRI